MLRIPSLILVLGALAASGAQSQPLPVAWQATVEPTSVRAGDIVTVTVRGAIDPGWRVYAMDSEAGRPLSVRFEAPPAIAPVGSPQQAQPQEGYDQWFQSDYTFFTEDVTVSQVFRINERAARGEARLEGFVTFMACNDDVCLPPRIHELSVPVQVRAGAGGSAGPSAAAPGSQSEEGETTGTSADMAGAVEPEDAAGNEEGVSVWTEEERLAGAAATLPPIDTPSPGMLAFILLAIGAGLAALVSPCVFPMIPLTVSYFVNQTGTRRRAVRMAAIYGLSIVAIFTGLGLAMALVVGAAGPMLIATNPWINLFLGVVLVAFGFSLLGFFEVRLPARWQNYFNNKGNERGGYVGVLFMGFTLTLVSFSCTVPFVGALLAQAVRAEWVYPIVGMVVFSTVFALPFVGFALFPRALQRLPRSGAWMTAFKGLLGFLVIAAAIQFLSNADLVWGLGLLPRPLAVALMIVIFALAGFFLLGRLQLGEANVDPEGTVRPASVGPFRLATAIACFGLALYMVPGLLGAPLGRIDAFLPPQMPSDAGIVASFGIAGQGGPAEKLWLESREEAFAEAQRRNVPVLVDFTGYTCTNCRYMEANVLNRPVVADRIREHFVPLKLWTDDARKGQELQRYQFELTGRITLPTYAVVTPDGQLVEEIGGVTSLQDFAAFLDRNVDASVALASR